MQLDVNGMHVPPRWPDSNLGMLFSIKHFWSGSTDAMVFSKIYGIENRITTNPASHDKQKLQQITENLKI